MYLLFIYRVCVFSRVLKKYRLKCDSFYFLHLYNVFTLKIVCKIFIFIRFFTFFSQNRFYFLRRQFSNGCDDTTQNPAFCAKKKTLCLFHAKRRLSVNLILWLRLSESNRRDYYAFKIFLYNNRNNIDLKNPYICPSTACFCLYSG